MIYCVNPQCSYRENSEDAITCKSCGTKLLVNHRYKLTKPLRELTGNHFTDIFLVRDAGLTPEDWGTTNVLKVLRYNNNTDLVRLFKQESRTLMWLKHSGVPVVEPDGYFTVNITRPAQNLHCLVMEFVEGDNLEEFLVKKGAIDEAIALEWLTQLAEILHLLHGQNLAHRDIKPSNLILRPNGQLTLIDFGTVGQGGLGEWGGTKVGSIGYAAPEQLNGSAVLASDFFALGRTLVHLLTDKTPLELENYQTEKELDLDFFASVRTFVDLLVNLLVDKIPLNLQNYKVKKKLAWRYYVRGGISDHLGNLIDELMAYKITDRPKNTSVLQNRLRFSPQEIAKQRLKRKLVLGGLLVFGIGIFPVYSQPIARGLNFASGNNIQRLLQNIGTDKFAEKELRSAEFFFNAALFFNPENQAAHYSLGRVCEQTNQVDCAMKKYRQVMLGKNDEATAAAISSLTRLQIIYRQPVDSSLINQGLTGSEDKRIQASLWKNLGWWQFQSNQIPAAEKSLKTSLELNAARPAAYCLLAQVLEAKKQETLALEQWSECAKRVDSNSVPEELNWGVIAQQRLTAADPNYKPNSIQPRDFKN